jgi:hypothetical protein
VVTGSTTKVKILHSLFSVNTDPDYDTLLTVVGVYGVNKVAPFKAVAAAGAVQALVPPRRSKKGDQGPNPPSSIQFSVVGSAEQFRDLVRDDTGEGINALANLPNSHFIRPQVFVDMEGKREWEAIELGCKLILLWVVQLTTTARFIDLLTCKDGIASEVC